MKANPGKKDQNLAIAFNVQRKNKRKKMASGGVVSAADESRPMPDTMGNDAAETMRNRNKAALMESDWTGAPQDREAAHDVSSPENEKNTSWTDGGEVSIGESRNAQSNSKDITANNESRPMPDNRYAHGGKVQHNPKLEQSQMSPDADDHYDNIADAILAKKRKAKMMADGGMVDLEANSEESPNMEDQMSFQANGKEQYDDSQISHQPMDSNEHGHELSDEDAHDMVDQIRKKMRSKGRI